MKNNGNTQFKITYYSAQTKYTLQKSAVLIEFQFISMNILFFFAILEQEIVLPQRFLILRHTSILGVLHQIPIRNIDKEPSILCEPLTLSVVDVAF